MSIPPIGSVITLECLGTAPGGPRFLDGRTMDGTVGLAATSKPSGTQWALTMHSQNVVILKCMGDAQGSRFLEGSTAERTAGLAANTTYPHTGTRWAIEESADRIVTLRCLSHADGDRFLDGRTMDGTVGLAPDTGAAFSGTRWRIRVTGKLVMIFCLGHIDGPRFLEGRTSDRSVGLAVTTADPFQGTQWHMIGDENLFILKCLGAGGGPYFLDGDTVRGRVGLAPRTSAPYSGTRWQKVGNALKCLGAEDGSRFLDGRTQDGSVVLVGDSNLSGSSWRILEPYPLSETHPPIAGAPITVRVAQLTGSNDPEDRPILNNTAEWGAQGLDLGANCEHSDGRIYLFMSDVVTEGNKPGGPAWDSDSVSWINATGLGGHQPAGLNFTLPFEPTSLQGEREWRYCRNCRALFYDGETGKGVCPAGDDNIRDGGHIPDGYKFVVPFESRNVSGQHEWRRCSKCQIMFFELYPDRGVCPAGGRHTGGGRRLVLPHDSADSSHQGDWRFCQWCRGLFFGGYPSEHGVCIAGGSAFSLHPVMSGDFFDPFKVAGPIKAPLNAETPTGAFSYDERLYVFIWIGDRRDQTHPPGSYLVSKPDPNHSGPYGEEFLFTAIGIAPKGFWQVAPWCIKNADIPGAFPPMKRTTGC